MEIFGPNDRRVGTSLETEGERGFIEGVISVDVNGDPVPTASGGAKDDSNSSTTPLGSAGEFTGEWVVNSQPQIAFNCLTDQDGTLYLEFSIDGTAALQTLSKSYQIFANSGEFDALVKMPGRFHRVRFVNGATAQTKFGLVTSTGDGLFPYSVSDRDAPQFVSSSVQSSSTTQYKIMVDLSDRATFPHHYTGRANLHSVFFFIDKGANTAGLVQIGVITRIDGTDADITYVQGVSFSSSSDRSFSRDRVYDSPLLLGQSGGTLTRASGSTETGVTAVNTGTSLDTPYGTATPALGDIVVKYTHTSGSAYTAFASSQYSASSSST